MNCIDNKKTSSSIRCNPMRPGCDQTGKINNNYYCLNDKLIFQSNLDTSNSDISILGNLVDFDQILLQFNSSINANIGTISIIVRDSGNKNYFCSKVNSFFKNSNSTHSIYEVKLPEKCRINCIKIIKISLEEIKLISKELNILRPTQIVINNLTNSKCRSTYSFYSKEVMKISGNLTTIIISGLIGSNFVSFNPIGIISLVNSIQEISIFQLLNLEPNYPKNVNEFLNSTSFISLIFFSYFDGLLI